MDDLWEKKVDIKLAEYNRRLNDHDRDIDMLKHIAEAMNKRIQQGEHTNELLAKAIVWLEKIAKLAELSYDVLYPFAVVLKKISFIGIPLIAIYHASKWVLVKISLVFP